MTESGLVSAIIEYLLFKHCLVIRINSGAVTPEDESGNTRFVLFNRWQVLGDDERVAGVSDIFALAPWGQWLVIEAKTDKGRVTDEQRRFMDEILKRGALAIVARSVDDVMGFFGEAEPIALGK